MNELKPMNFNGVDAVDSRQVAEAIGKEHYDLLKDIRKYCGYLGDGKIPFTDFFIESTYKTEQNKEMPCYLCTKKGCELIAHKLTGKKGVQFTALYINAFHKMEKQYKQPEITLNTSYSPEETPFGLPIREYNGQRVLTFRDIADVHQRKLPAIRKDFRYNSKYFIEGKDFFFVKLEDVKKYKIQISGITVPVKGITLFTESGYLILVKSFKDYLSRNVQEQLVNTYFNAPEQVQTAETISLQEDKLLMLHQRLTELENRMNKLERKMDGEELTVRDIITFNSLLKMFASPNAKITLHTDKNIQRR